MNIIRLSGFALASIVVGFAGCSSSEDMVAPPGTHVAVTIVPVAAAAEEPVLIRVFAQDAGAAIKSVSIDYTGDGTWEEIRSFDENEVETEFSHVYDDPGNYVLKIEAVNASDVGTLKSVTVAVGPARNVPVSYIMLGSSTQGGICSAQGAPACPSCGVTLTGDPATSARRSMGMFAHGAWATLSQGFGQFPYVAGHDVLYSCRYDLQLVAGSGPLERPFASGSCTTDSTVSPARLNCTITAAGPVP